MLTVAIGFSSLMGASTAGRSIPYQYAETIARASPYERAKQMVSDLNQSYSFLFLWGTAGVTCAVLGGLIHALAG
jgi:hypothetical protein